MKDIVKGLKKQIPGWENVFKNYISNKGLVSRIYKELSKLNRKKIVEKISEETTSIKRIYRWQLSTWTDVQLPWLSGKCKLKRRWNTSLPVLKTLKRNKTQNKTRKKEASKETNQGKTTWQYQRMLRMGSNWIYHRLLMGMQSGTATMERLLLLLVKLNLHLATWPTTSPLKYFP